MLTVKLGDPDTVTLTLDDREGVPDKLWDTAADGVTLELGLVLSDTAGVTLELELVLSDTAGVTLELGLGLSDTAGVTLEVELEEVVAVILVLCDTAVVGDPLVLELEEPVADTVVLSDTAVVGEPLVLEEAVADTVVLSDIAVVTLGLDEMVVDKLELELRDIDTDGELEIAGPAPTATNAMFVD